MVTVSARMALIEGVGDEVVLFMTIVFLVGCVMLAWFSTSVAEQPLIRTAVLVIERRRTSSRINETVQETERTPDLNEPAGNVSKNAGSFQPSSASNGDDDEVDSIPGTSESSTESEPGPSHTGLTVESQQDNAFTSGSCVEEVRSEYLRKRTVNPDQPIGTTSNSPSPSNEEAITTEALLCTAETTEIATFVMANTGNDSEEGTIRIRLKFLNDTQRMVEGKLEEQLGEFKRRYFGEELENDKIVRLIFNGQLLRSDQETLQFYGLFDNCVVHCQISNNIAPPPSGQSEAYNELDLSRFMLPLFGVILGAIWYCRIQYRQFFNATSTFALLGITGLFFVSLVALFIPRREHRQPPAWANDDVTSR